jgi:RNA polymerase sigma factor (sigma-70 family)
MTNNNKSALKEQFNYECQIINLKYEYPGYTGIESFGIITSLSKSELNNKYSKLLIEYTPYILLDCSFKNTRDNFRRNEKKHYARAVRGHIFGFDDEFEEHHPEFATEDCWEQVVANEQNQKLKDAINRLDEKQRRRLIQYFVNGKTYRDIAQIEGVDHRAVNRSVEAALKNLKKFLV